MDKRIRKRGIKASREKLEIAMLDSGIKTQASLAYKIAEVENLSSPPKDTINRAFREEFVSPATITRIAKILSVEPHFLYLSKEQVDKTNMKVPEFKKNNTSLPGKISLALIPVTHELGTLSNSINRQLKGFIKSTVLNPSQMPNQYMSVDIARKYHADGVLTVRSDTIARYQAIQIFLFFKGVEKLIWTDSITSLELDQHPDDVAARFIPFISSLTGTSVSHNKNNSSFATIEEQEKYLKARILLDDHHSDLSLKRAQKLLHSALKTYPEFALAQAALAESYICESWRSDTRELLVDARQACDKALEIAPDNSYIITTLSHLYRISGLIPESIKLCQKVLQAQPDNIDAICGLAATYIEAYSQDITGVADAEKQALHFAEKAIEMEPDYWKHHFELGNYRFMTNQPLQALPAYESAANLNPNDIIYINLGVISFCQNQLSNAKKFFQKAHELDPESYLGNEYLGSIFYYTGEYKKAIEYRVRAIDSFEDRENITIHQIWGDLADSYRLADNQYKAIEAYSTAIEIIDRDKIQGYSNKSFKVYHYYYYFFMSYFQPDQYPPVYLIEIAHNLSDLIELDLNPGAYAKLAHLLYLEGNYGESKKALQKATQICPVFFQHPDLRPIIQELGFTPKLVMG